MAKALLSLSLRDKFTLDLLGNLASLAVIGVAGIAANLVIGIVWGAGSLGVFNQVFSVYILLSQASVLGFHIAALTYSSTVTDAAQQRGLVAASVFLTAISATVVTALFWAVSESVGQLLSSPSIADGMRWAAAGLWLFSFNKLFLAVLNGQNRMQIYALLQIIRAVVLVGTIAVAAILGADPRYLPISLTAAEAATFIAALPFMVPHLVGVKWTDLKRWIRIVLDFGLRSAPSGMLAEINTRVDILTLGVLTTDQVVGVYSFASVMAEGIYQVLIVLRTVYAPLVARALQSFDRSSLLALTHRAKRMTYFGMAALCALAFLLFPLLIELSGRSNDFSASWPIFGILLSGIALSAGYAPFGTVLALAGQPAWHSIYIAAVVTFNVAANLILVPLWAANGAALATATAHVFAAFSLILLVRRRLGFSI